MKIKTIIAAAFIMLFLTSSCLADKPAIIGGIRRGLALGVLGEKNLSSSLDLRFGFEADTTDGLGVGFAGAKLSLANVTGQMPVYFSIGVVSYVGNGLETGAYLSVIWEKFLGMTPLFLETGIDFVNSFRPQLQVGYYF